MERGNELLHSAHGYRHDNRIHQCSLFCFKKSDRLKKRIMTESTDYPYNKVNILPRVEGFKAIPRNPESKAHILYQTTSQAYGQVLK